MKIFFVDPPGWQKESVNLGLANLAGALKKEGHISIIIDANSSKVSDDILIEKIKETEPDVIGFSIKTATANEAARMAEVVRKKFPDVKIIVGGPHVTLCADDYMIENPQFDFAIVSEAEEAIVNFVNAIDAGQQPGAEIENLVWRKGDEIIINQWSPPADLDSLPLPLFESIDGFSFEGFRYPIVTSRGCPFKCTYCCVNKLTGSFKWRWATPEKVVAELERVARVYGITQFEIWDDNFTLNVKRAKEICNLLIDRDLNLSWYCHNGIRADKVDSELAGLMKQAGCTSIAFGVESGNEEVFDSIKKGEELSDIVNAVKTIKGAGINAVGYYLIGIPGDTLEKFITTVEFQRSLPFDHFVYGMLIPYPKTEVWDIVMQRGKFLERITDSQHFCDDLVPVSFEMPEFPKEDMIRSFYISRYYELFKTIRQNEDNKKVTVIYIHTEGMDKAIAGMAIALGNEANQVIVSLIPDEFKLDQPAFAQVPESVKPVVTSFDRLPKLSGDKNMIIVVAQKDGMEKVAEHINHVDLYFEHQPGNALFPLVERRSTESQSDQLKKANIAS